MRHALIVSFALLFGITVAITVGYIFTLPETRVVLSRFEPPIYDTSENPDIEVSDPYHIDAGAYTIAHGTTTFTLAHPRDSLETYRGHTPVRNGALILTTDSTGSIMGSGSITIDASTLIFSSNTATTYARNVQDVFVQGSHFFNATQHPDVTFLITSIKKIPSTNNNFTFTTRLTFLGQTHDLSFPVTLFVRNGMLRLETDFAFDRTQWGMTYASASFVGENASNALSDMLRTGMSITFRYDN